MKVIDHTGDKKYFTQIPNIIFDLPLSPLAQSLYIIFKRIGGESRRISIGTKKLQDRFGVGFKSIQSAKQELQDHKLITVKSFPTETRRSDEIKILDIWHRNGIFFADLFDDTTLPQEQSNEFLTTLPQEQTTLPQEQTTLPQEQTTLPQECLKNIKDIEDDKEQVACHTNAEKTETQNIGRAKQCSTNVNEVFEYWRSTLGKKNFTLTPDRHARIKTRLKRFSVDQLKQAIDGTLKDDWLMGRSPNSTKTYNDFETIFRNDSKIETLIELSKGNLQIKNPTPPSNGNYLTAEMIAKMENEPIN